VTVISDNIENVAGVDDTTAFVFSAPLLRESADGLGMITTQTARVTATGGVLTTPDLDPGDATVRIGANVYPIEIPDSPTPVRLWPLIFAGLPVPPEQVAQAVRNGGGIAVAQAITQATYNALTTPDPATLYVING
jgi:hypothetical protein